MSELIDTAYKIAMMVLALGSLGMALLILRLKTEFVAKREHDDLKGRVESHHNRLSILEQRIATLPDGPSLGAINVALAELRGDIKALTATSKALADTVSRADDAVTRMEQHLLERSK